MSSKAKLIKRIEYLENTVNHLVTTRPYAECNCPCKSVPVAPTPQQPRWPYPWNEVWCMSDNLKKSEDYEYVVNGNGVVTPAYRVVA